MKTVNATVKPMSLTVMLSGETIITPTVAPEAKVIEPSTATYGSAGASSYAMSAANCAGSANRVAACPLTAISLMTTSRPPVLVISIAPTASPQPLTQMCAYESDRLSSCTRVLVTLIAK